MKAEIKRLIGEMKTYNIRQREICKQTGLKPSMVCRYFKGIKQKDEQHGKLIYQCAKRLVDSAKLGQKS